MWPDTRLARLLGVRLPIVQAPMSGGPSTPALAAAVSEAGALGSLGAGLLTVEALREAVAETQRLTRRPFLVNLFVPNARAADPARVRAAWEILRPVREELGLPDEPPPEPVPFPFASQVDALVRARVPVVSFTFGLPPPEVVDDLRGAGARVLATVTNVREAREAAARGVDALVLQGSEAGGHRGGWVSPDDPPLVGLAPLLRRVLREVDLPLVASGGIADGRGVAAALALGAEGVQLGTAFLCAEESGAHPEQKRAVLEAGDRETVVTRCWSGKPARVLPNAFVAAMEAHERDWPSYPEHLALMQPLIQAAWARSMGDLLPIFAGQAAPLARKEPARDIVARLARETEAALKALA
jgi:nitronate monooxygenase